MSLSTAELGTRLRALGVQPLVDAAGTTPVFLVGGAVRDVLLDRQRSDVDVAVEGNAAAIAAALGGEVFEHERFGTAVVTIGSHRIDLAATRAETYATPGALPDVRSAGIGEDLARRDFTINAMAIPLQGAPELIDPHRGERDLDAGLLRVLHSDSFADDPTRALRAARYGARLGFDLEPESEAFASQVDLSTVSRARIEAELLRIAGEPQALRGFELLDSWGVLRLSPGAEELVAESMALLGTSPWSELADPQLTVYAAALGSTPGEAGRRLDLHSRARELAATAPERPSEGVALARDRSVIELLLARAMGTRWIEDYVERWRDVGLEIDGADLLAEGVAEGPEVGRGLDEALRRKLDGEIDGRAQELEVALAAARAGAG